MKQWKKQFTFMLELISFLKLVSKTVAKIPSVDFGLYSKLNLPDIKTESFCFDQLYFNNQPKTHFRKKKSLTTKEDHFVSNSVTTKKNKN
jgi:hypothetical protein